VLSHSNLVDAAEIQGAAERLLRRVRIFGGVLNANHQSGTNTSRRFLEFLQRQAGRARLLLLKRERLQRNQFGTIGGPVVIPKLYDGRNRHSSSSATRECASARLLFNSIVPTAAMKRRLQPGFEEDQRPVYRDCNFRIT
jgi:hypothetical protein